MLAEAIQPQSAIARAIENTYKNDTLWDVLANSGEFGAGPFDGGCLICAAALVDVFGGELAFIADERLSGNASHYGAFINGKFYDFNGEYQTGDEFIRVFSENELLDASTLSIKHGKCPNDTQIPFIPILVTRVAALLNSA